MNNGKEPKVAVSIIVNPDDSLTFNLNVPVPIAVHLMQTVIIQLCTPQSRIYKPDDFKLRS